MKIDGTGEQQKLHENSVKLLNTVASEIPNKGIASSPETRKSKKVAPIQLHQQLRQTSTSEGKSDILTKNLSKNNPTSHSKRLSRASSSRERGKLASSSETWKSKKIASIKPHQQLRQPRTSQGKSDILINNLSKKTTTSHSKQRSRASSSESASESVDSRSSRSRSRSSRLGFDGVVKTSPSNSGERNPGPFAEPEQTRSIHVVGKSSTMITTAQDTLTNPSVEGFVSPIQPPVPVNENHSQQNPNAGTTPTIPSQQSLNVGMVHTMLNDGVSLDNVEMAIGQSQVGKYAGDEESEKCPSIVVVVVDNGERSACCVTRTSLIWGIIICFAIIGTSVTIPCVLLLGDSSNENGDNSILELPNANSGSLVSSISSDICSESVPKSGDCTPVDSNDVHFGGDLCNLVAKTMINTTVYGDISLINAAICKGSFLAPDITVTDIHEKIAMEDLMVVEMSGANIVSVLNEALTATFGENGDFKAYPYAAGLRYSVSANLPPSKRLSNIEVNSGLRDSTWEPIDILRFYKVITTESLANGDMGYTSFQNVVDDWKDQLNIDTGDAFYSYAMTTTDAEWSILPDSEYSTQHFVGENVEPTIATVPSRLCHALIPGKPESSFCTSADVVHGGEVCNLVSWAIYDQNFGVDVVELNGDMCAGDVEEGDFFESSFGKILSGNKSLVTFDRLGSEIVTVISEGVSSAVINGATGNYPYTAGLRFDVSTISSPMVSNVQVFSSSRGWIPIVGTESYTIATTSELAKPSGAQDMGTTIQEAITDYAIDWKMLYKIPQDKVSTQSFI